MNICEQWKRKTTEWQDPREHQTNERERGREYLQRQKGSRLVRQQEMKQGKDKTGKGDKARIEFM